MSTAPPNFDRVAHIYRWAEYLALGRLLENTRQHFIPCLGDRRRALVLGDGDGRFLALLLRANPLLMAKAVDTSRAMLSLLTARCAAAIPGVESRLTTVCDSALAVHPHPETDLIATHFFLDCLTQNQVETLAQQIAAQVNSGTLWLVSDFAVPDKPVVGPLARLYIRALYLAFGVLTGLRVTSLPDTTAALTVAGFERLSRHESVGGLLYSELWRRR